MQQSWKRKQCVLFCLLSAEGLVSQPSVLWFRLKVSGESVQHQWPTSQTAFNRLYSWFEAGGGVQVKDTGLIRGKESWFFKGTEADRSPNSGRTVMLVSVCTCVYFFFVRLWKQTHVFMWRGVCVRVCVRAKPCMVCHLDSTKSAWNSPIVLCWSLISIVKISNCVRHESHTQARAHTHSPYPQL